MPPQSPATPRQIAMIHTVSSLIPLFDGLAKQHLPRWQGLAPGWKNRCIWRAMRC